MNTLKQKIEKFLKCKNIAVIGVSASSQDSAANYNFKKLESLGYYVYPVNPNHRDFNGHHCYKSIKDIEGIEAALIFTAPDVTAGVTEECLNTGIKNIWIHRSFGKGSCSTQASEIADKYPGINFIDGACPMMFVNGADWVHKCFRMIMKFSGRLPN